MDIVERLKGAALARVGFTAMLPETEVSEAADEITRLRAEVERLKEQLRYEKMNTDVWQRDAEGKLEDRTEAYQRISELTAALKVAKDAMAFKTKPLCMCFAGCGECQPDPMPPTLEEAIATIDEALK